MFQVHVHMMLYPHVSLNIHENYLGSIKVLLKGTEYIKLYSDKST